MIRYDSGVYRTVVGRTHHLVPLCDMNKKILNCIQRFKYEGNIYFALLLIVLSIKSKQEVYNHLFASGEYNRNLRPEINNGEDPVMTNMMPILMRIRGLVSKY